MIRDYGVPKTDGTRNAKYPIVIVPIIILAFPLNKFYMRFIIFLFILIASSCSELCLTGSYIFIIENKSPYNVVVVLDHNYPDEVGLKPDVMEYILNPILKPGEAVYYGVNLSHVIPKGNFSGENITPIWDEYYIREIRINDIILDENKWRSDSCWEKKEVDSYHMEYLLSIL